MSFEGLTGRADRVIAWADRLQRKHGVLGFPYAGVKKYGDDGGGREAARLRAGFVPRYARVLVMLAKLMLGTLAVGTLTVAATALPGEPWVQRASAVLGSALAVFAVLLLGARLLLVRPAPFRALGRGRSWARRW